MKMFFLLTLAILGALLGCSSEEKFEDVSGDPKFHAAIEARYEIVGAVDAYGIRPHSKGAVDYITLIPPPGIEGPEVGFKVPIRTGSTITVVKVLRTNRVFDPTMSFVVKLEGTGMPVNVPTRIELFRGNGGAGFLQLNPAIYRQLPSG